MDSSWILPTSVTAGALVAALLAARKLKPTAKGKAASAPKTPVAAQAADIDARLNDAVAQLRDLELQQPRLDPATYNDQKTALEAQAADLLRRQESLRQQLTRPAAPASELPAPDHQPGGPLGWLAARPQLKGALWGAGVVAVVMGLYQWVNTVQKPRAANAPMTGGESVNGGNAPMAAASGKQAAQADPEWAELHKKVKANPNDVDTLVRLAHKLLRAMMLNEAKMVNDRALGLDPNQLEAQVHQAVIQAGQGNATAGMEALNKLVEEHPKLAEAWFFRGMLSMQAGHQERMRESFSRYVEVAPPGPRRDRIARMLENMAQ